MCMDELATQQTSHRRNKLQVDTLVMRRQCSYVCVYNMYYLTGVYWYIHTGSLHTNLTLLDRHIYMCMYEYVYV